jgi:hypothetical protein
MYLCILPVLSMLLSLVAGQAIGSRYVLPVPVTHTTRRMFLSRKDIHHITTADEFGIPRTVNTEVAGPTTVSPTQTTQSTATTSDEHTANTIVSGPTTISPTTSTGTTAPTSDEVG